MVLSKLFGKKDSRDEGNRREGDPVEHNGFRIIPAPLSQQGAWYVAGRIERTTTDGTEIHEFVRADTHGDWEQACEHTIQKAMRTIDEQGERIFRAQD